MKKTIFVIMMALLAVAGMNAQPQGRGPRPGNMNPETMIEHRIAMLDKQLQLTPEQKTAIAAIYTEQAEQMKAQMQQKFDKKEQPKPEEMKAHHEQMKASQAEVDAKVAAVLTAEQKEKYEQLQAERGIENIDFNKAFDNILNGGQVHDCGKEKAECGQPKHECKDKAAGHKCDKEKAAGHDCGKEKAECGQPKHECKDKAAGHKCDKEKAAGHDCGKAKAECAKQGHECKDKAAGHKCDKEKAAGHDCSKEKAECGQPKHECKGKEAGHKCNKEKE